MSLISSLNIAQQALSVNQTAITTVSQNVANVDTEGYSKLRVNLKSVVTGGLASNAVAVANSLSGVQVSNIQRYADFSQECYYWQENSTNSYLTQYAKSGTTVQNLVNELNDTGLASALNDFYDAVDALGDNPSDLTSRQNYVSAADNLCTVFNNISSNLTYVQESLVGTSTTTAPSQLDDSLSSANDLLDQIASVNKTIVKTNANGESLPALLDQRDALVSQLSSLIPVNASENANGTISVSLGNYSLVKGVEVQGYLQASNNQDAQGHTVTTLSLVDKDGNTTYSDVTPAVSSGSIGAILDIAGTDKTNLTISGILDSINELASEFATAFNNIQLNADASGTPLCIDQSTKTLTPATEEIFATKDGTATITAANISINSAVTADPYLVAAARTDTTSATYSNTQTGNNSNVTKMLAVRSTTMAGLDNMDMEDFLSSKVSQVGTQVKEIETTQETQESVLQSVQSKLASETGVNLDEELVDLMKFQRAYQAAARIFSTCDSLLEELLNLGR